MVNKHKERDSLAMRSVPFVLPLLVSLVLFGIYMTCTLVSLDDGPLNIPPEKRLPKLNMFERVTEHMSHERDFRLVFIGDVHGQYDDLQRFIDEELGGLVRRPPLCFWETW